MPYQAYPFHWPLVHWPQRAYDPRVVADGFKCKTSGNFPSESCGRWRQTGESQEPWNPFHGIFLQLLHLCRGSLRVKGEKIEVNKMKNHDGSHTPRLWSMHIHLMVWWVVPRLTQWAALLVSITTLPLRSATGLRMHLVLPPKKMVELIPAG